RGAGPACQRQTRDSGASRHRRRQSQHGAVPYGAAAFRHGSAAALHRVLSDPDVHDAVPARAIVPADWRSRPTGWVVPTGIIPTAAPAPLIGTAFFLSAISPGG